jgi:hypothetical protein
VIDSKGRLGWQKIVGYGKRSLVEVAILRYKVLIGRSLNARTLPAQKVEATVACKVINIMTGLGMRSPAGAPDHRREGRNPALPDFCTNVSANKFSAFTMRDGVAIRFEPAKRGTAA